MAYHSGRPLLINLLKLSREEIGKHDPETEALAIALYKETRLVLERKGKMPVQMLSEDLPRAPEADPPDKTATQAADRALYKEALLAGQQANEVPKRRPPIVLSSVNDFSKPYLQKGTPRPTVS